MPSIRAWLSRFAGLFARRRADDRLRAELDSHLVMLAEENERRGLSPQEARRQARITLGGVEQTKQLYREQRGIPWLEHLVGDFRYAFRVLGRSRGTALAIIVLLTLGIGGVTALFGPLYSLVLLPLPYPHSDRIVRIGGNIPIFDGYFSEFVHPERLEPLFSAIAAYSVSQQPLTVGTRSIEANFATVNTGFFATLGVRPWLGSIPTAKAPGPYAQEAVSYAFWKTELNGDKGVIGRSNVTAVMPPGFDFPPGTNIWVPQPTGAGWPGMDPELLGRLRASLSLDQAAAGLKGLGYKHMGPSDGLAGGSGPVLETLHDFLLGDRKPLLWTLWSVSLLFLLLACAGAANLLFARGVRRQPEMVVRLALGAGRGRLIRQLLAEALLLATTGGLLGLGLAAGGVRWIAVLLPAARGTGSVSLSGLGLVALLAVAATILCGLAPAFHATGGDLNAFLKTGTTGITQSMPRHRLFGSHELLAGAQLVVATVLLISTGLLVRSLVARLSIPLGFDPHKVAVVETDLPEYAPAIAAWQNFKQGHPVKPGSPVTPEWVAAEQAALRPTEEAEFAYFNRFYSGATGRLAALPGVASVATLDPPPFDTSQRPWWGYNRCLSAIRIIPNRYGGEITHSGPATTCLVREVSPKAFRILGVRLLSGRNFTSGEVEDYAGLLKAAQPRSTSPEGPPVAPPVIINEALANLFWPNQIPLGKRFWTPGFALGWHTVVGVVSDIRESPEVLGSRPTMYLPDWQPGPGKNHFVVKLRTGASLSAFAASARRTLTLLDADMPPPTVTSLESDTTASLANLQLALALLGCFTVLGIVVAALGVYAAATLMAAARTREMGIRIALGAHAEQIRGLAVGRSLRLVLFAVPVGALCAWGLARSLSHWLFQVSAADPATYVVSGALLALIALAAGLVPARRAARVDPAVALREE